MSNIFKSKEVYKHLKTTGDRPSGKMVPVQGLYVSGEFRPPYYTEGQIHITQIASQPATAVSFKNVSRTDEDGCVKVLDFRMTKGSVTITNYTTASTDGGEDCCVKILDFWLTTSTPTFNWYTSASVDAGEDCCVKILDFSLNSNFERTFTQYTHIRRNSTPEPILRVTGIGSENCIVENL